jgi:hypothetical protein
MSEKMLLLLLLLRCAELCVVGACRGSGDAIQGAVRRGSVFGGRGLVIQVVRNEVLALGSLSLRRLPGRREWKASKYRNPGDWLGLGGSEEGARKMRSPEMETWRDKCPSRSCGLHWMWLAGQSVQATLVHTGNSNNQPNPTEAKRVQCNVDGRPELRPWVGLNGRTAEGGRGEGGIGEGRTRSEVRVGVEASSLHAVSLGASYLGKPGPALDALWLLRQLRPNSVFRMVAGAKAPRR